MTQLLQETIQKSKDILRETDGEQAYALIESCFYGNISLHELFAPLKEKDQIHLLISNIDWIDFFEMYSQFSGTRNKLNQASLFFEIRLNFKKTWSFYKTYNSASGMNFRSLDEQMNVLIAEIENLLEDLNNDYLSSEIFHFDAHGYDYSLVAIEFREGVQVIEFLWYMD
jgi:hypothetical protein